MIAATVAKAAAEKATAGAKRIYVCGGVLIVDLLQPLEDALVLAVGRPAVSPPFSALKWVRTVFRQRRLMTWSLCQAVLQA